MDTPDLSQSGCFKSGSSVGLWGGVCAGGVINTDWWSHGHPILALNTKLVYCCKYEKDF